MVGRELRGKTAIVTGASRGIGAAIARRLTAEGVRVVVNYLSNEVAALAVVREITDAGGEACAVRADVSDPGKVAPLFEEAERAFGFPDILINNAGMWENRTLPEIDLRHFETVFGVNVRGALLCMREFAQRGRAGGRIVNISSIATSEIMPGSSVYCASKAALEALTRIAAADLGPKGITVNAVAPGLIATEGLAPCLSEQMRRDIAGNTALGRIGTPEDVADVVAFLCSHDARWVTGQFVVVSGGLRM